MTHTTDDLYAKVGGPDGADRILRDFYYRVRADAELAPFFTNTDMDKLLAMQREYLATALGGPAVYSGTGLRDAHEGRNIRGRHFVRFLDLFLVTLADAGLDEHDIDQVIDRMAMASTDVLGTTTESG